MDNTSLVMDMLRVATEENEATLTTDSHTPSANPYQLPVPPEFVSQFRIDGQPILPPLMTTEKRRQMQELRKQALQVEARYKQANAVKKPTTEHEPKVATSVSNYSTSTTTSSNSSSRSNTSSSSINNNSNCVVKDSAMNNTQRMSQLQQTQTFIYDSTRQQEELKEKLALAEQLDNFPRSRPLTLDIDHKDDVDISVIPTICVNPPTPQRDQQSTRTPASASTTSGLDIRTYPQTKRQRKLNNITSRILKFERTGLNKKSPLQPQAALVLWQNEAIVSAADKRMLRSSTSPSLSAAQMQMTQLHRSRSFTLDKPSQALVDHMQRKGEKTPTPSPPSAMKARPQSSPRCRFVLPGSVSCCSSAQNLTHLRRDTIESKAKQVQRSASSSCVDAFKSPALTRRRQQHQQQLEQLLQRALHETNGMLADQMQKDCNQLALTKRQMIKDIKSAHRDRFQQLVHYQHEEQRRMQAEFDRQQKFLIEQICAEINASAYAQEPQTDVPRPIGISEYTSTDDLPTPSRSSPTNTITVSSPDGTPHIHAQLEELYDKNSGARKCLFKLDNDAEEPTELLPLQSPSSSPRSGSQRSRSTNSSKIKKPVQRSHSKPPMSKKANSPVTAAKSLQARTVTHKTLTPATTKVNSRSQQQTQQRRNVSPSRQTRFMAKK